jgi:hypothetical protein
MSPPAQRNGPPPQRPAAEQISHRPATNHQQVAHRTVTARQSAAGRRGQWSL